MYDSIEIMKDSDIEMIKKYVWRAELKTPDPYDVWNMKAGQLVKKIYYRNKLIGSAPAALLTLFDFYLNNTMRIGYAPRRYPIAYAFMTLINLELYKNTLQNRFISIAENSLEWLSNNYSISYSGYCWGINMPWVSKIATYNENKKENETFIKFSKHFHDKGIPVPKIFIADKDRKMYLQDMAIGYRDNFFPAGAAVDSSKNTVAIFLTGWCPHPPER